MKKFFFSTMALLVFSGIGFAQKFQLGIKAGANFSNYSGSSSINDVKTNTMIGFHAGLLTNLKFGSAFSIQPEILVSSQGAKLKNASKEENFKATYATLPIMLKLQTGGGVYIEAGPQFGLKISDNISGVNTDVKNLDASLAAGIGFHSRMGLGIGARYIAGLSKVGDIDFGGSISPDYKNSNIQVSLFYTFFNNR